LPGWGRKSPVNTKKAPGGCEKGESKAKARGQGEGQKKKFKILGGSELVFRVNLGRKVPPGRVYVQKLDRKGLNQMVGNVKNLWVGLFPLTVIF